MNKLIPLFLFIILLASFVIAVPPFQTSGGTNILDIRIPQVEFLKLNQDVTSHIHVWNATNGLPMDNTTTSCLLHLYNKTGSHILETEYGFEDNGLDWDLKIGGGNFSVIGIYSFIVQCNTSNIGGEGVGGFVSSSLEVTESGTDESNLDNTSGIAIVIFMLFATSLFFLLPMVKKPLVNNEFANLILKRSCYIVGIFLMSLNSAIIATIAAESWLPLKTEFLYGYMWIFNWGGYLLMFFTVLMTIYDLLQLKHLKDAEERYGD